MLLYKKLLLMTFGTTLVESVELSYSPLKPHCGLHSENFTYCLIADVILVTFSTNTETHEVTCYPTK